MICFAAVEFGESAATSSSMTVGMILVVRNSLTDALGTHFSACSSFIRKSVVSGVTSSLLKVSCSHSRASGPQSQRALLRVDHVCLVSGSRPSKAAMRACCGVGAGGGAGGVGASESVSVKISVSGAGAGCMAQGLATGMAVVVDMVAWFMLLGAGAPTVKWVILGGLLFSGIMASVVDNELRGLRKRKLLDVAVQIGAPANSEGSVSHYAMEAVLNRVNAFAAAEVVQFESLGVADWLQPAAVFRAHRVRYDDVVGIDGSASPVIPKVVQFAYAHARADAMNRIRTAVRHCLLKHSGGLVIGLIRRGNHRGVNVHAAEKLLWAHYAEACMLWGCHMPRALADAGLAVARVAINEACDDDLCDRIDGDLAKVAWMRCALVRKTILVDNLTKSLAVYMKLADARQQNEADCEADEGAADAASEEM